MDSIEPIDAEVVIEVDDLRVRRGGVEVLRAVSFSVQAGEVVGLLGPSGGGKSTLMRALVGVQAKVDGTCRVLGRAAGDAALRSQVGYVTQSPAVYADLTVRENLRYFAAVVGSGPERVDHVIALVDLGAEADRLVTSLSGGQRNRVSLGVALLGAPALLVLDEPTVGLDPVLRRNLWGLFHQLAAEGTTLLVSSHVMDEAAQCDRFLLLREGELLADDTEVGLLASTGTTTVEGAFLALVEGG